jgi:predicted amidohydrolase
MSERQPARLTIPFHAQLGGIVSRNRLPVVIRALRLTDVPKYYKLFKIGESPFGRYSQEAAIFLRREILKLDLDRNWPAEKRRPLPRLTPRDRQSVTGRRRPEP